MPTKMFIVTVLVILAVPLTVVSLECYNCSNITSLASCNTLAVCQSGEVCNSEFSTVSGVRRYTLGCKSSSSCPPYPTVGAGSGTIVGRSVVSAQDDHCSECCESGLCNRELCQNYDPDCVDKSDCSAIGSITNICAQVDHVKNVCKKFCGLCNLVDGGWSQWSTWSACDSTCENGTMTRTRVCDNPAPANGGDTCLGDLKETESCSSNRNCPVPGGWSQWSSWGSCSVSCDIGMQRRDRSCSQPYPSYGGDSCFGDGRDDRLCLPGPCANGNWSNWGQWGSCSKSCGGGLRTRSRNCNNPVPSLSGKYCTGHGFDASICNLASCQGPVVFYARDLSTVSPGSNAALIFTNVKTNVGSAYNNRTGFFTTPVSGSYSFSIQFCTYYHKQTQVGLYINNVQYQSLYTYDNGDHSCRTLSVSALLKQGDKVHAKTDHYTDTGQAFFTDTYRINSFSGSLVMRV